MENFPYCENKQATMKVFLASAVDSDLFGLLGGK